MTDFGPIAIVGGTGALGGGLAMALARAGLDVIIGSRDAAKASVAAAEIAAATGATVTGAAMRDAAKAADIVFVAVPFSSQAETLAAIAPAVAGKVVIDTTVPLVPPKVARVQLPEAGSAAAVAAKALGPDVRLVTGFHSVSAQKLRDGEGLESDVLIFGDDIAARDVVEELLARMGLNGVHGGPLANSVAAEAMTSVLIGINRRYKVEKGAGIRITGLATGSAEA